jgi:hypothetical protein
VKKRRSRFAELVDDNSNVPNVNGEGEINVAVAKAAQISVDIYENIQNFLTLCKEQRLNEQKRSQEMENLRQETAMAT